jgi:HSP20 family protein
MTVIRWRPFGQTLDRWDPSREMSDLQTEVNRLFGTFLGRSPLASVSDSVWVPPVDMHETKDELVISTELPGVTEKDIQLSITGDVLSLRGERKGQEEASDRAHHRSERWYGKFERTIQLPIPVQADRVKATFRDGVLTITLPKVEEIKPKQIKIDIA